MQHEQQSQGLRRECRGRGGSFSAPQQSCRGRARQTTGKHSSCGLPTSDARWQSQEPKEPEAGSGKVHMQTHVGQKTGRRGDQGTAGLRPVSHHSRPEPRGRRAAGPLRPRVRSNTAWLRGTASRTLHPSKHTACGETTFIGKLMWTLWSALSPKETLKNQSWFPL